MNLIITAGGTGGHIYPALSIIDKFKEKEKDLNVLYIGTHNRMEKDIVPSLGIRYESLEIYGFSKTDIIRDFKNIYLIKKAKDKCLKIMKEFKPDIVIGVGGYVTYPVLSAARSLGIKTFIHEQNSIPGKSNIVLSKKVDLVGVSFENSKSYFKKAKKVVYTGNPCGDRALNAPKLDKTTLGFKKTKKLVTIVAGSLGSSTFNNILKEFLLSIEKEDYQVLYITGKSYYDNFIKDIEFPNNVIIKPYMENLTGLMKDTDLFISRAGAGAITESLALCLPTIFVPSPYVANNHQYYNALEIKNKKAALLIEEKDLNARKLNKEINSLFTNKEKYSNLKEHIKKMDITKSADIIYNEIKDLIK
ncbi:MAG: undecaprenyldiphospho-muramoylpentapeptide beta-N-acetylglucosaminyltransferase [Bacilli bacterium]|nr:undecaprenyldiphospho-muramoylpentapeptide beta-N-acetylglucosaminyltransferase [Bacilli bacterium]